MAHVRSLSFAPLLIVAMMLVACGGDPENPVEQEAGFPLPSDSQLSSDQQREYREFMARIDAEPTADLYGDFGKRLLADGFAQAAEAAFLEARSRDGERYEWLYYLAHTVLGAGRHREAATMFEAATEQRPEEVAPWVWLGQAYFRDADYAAARGAFEQALTLQEDAASAHLGLGRTLLAQRDYDGAVASLTRALELSPRADIAHYPLAQAYRALGATEDAERHLALRGEREAYPYDPLMEEVRSGFGGVGVFIDRGGSAYASGEFSRATAAFQRATEIDPMAAIAFANLGASLTREGNLEAARAAYERARELDATDPVAEFGLAVLALRESNDDLAIDGLRATLDKDPAYVLAHLELAHRLAARKRWDEAAEHYRAALESDPRRAVAQWGLASVWIRAGEWQRARAQLQQAQQTLPDQPAFAHALARVLAAAPADDVRDGAGALQLVDTLMRGGMQNTDVGETLAMALAESGQFEQAQRIQRQVLEAVQAGADRRLASLAQQRLEAYAASRPWRAPWPNDDPFLQPPSDAEPPPPRRGA